VPGPHPVQLRHARTLPALHTHHLDYRPRGLDILESEEVGVEGYGQVEHIPAEIVEWHGLDLTDHHDGQPERGAACDRELGVVAEHHQGDG